MRERRRRHRTARRCPADAVKSPQPIWRTSACSNKPRLLLGFLHAVPVLGIQPSKKATPRQNSVARGADQRGGQLVLRHHTVAISVQLLEVNLILCCLDVDMARLTMLPNKDCRRLPLPASNSVPGAQSQMKLGRIDFGVSTFEVPACILRNSSRERTPSPSSYCAKMSC